MYMSLFLKSGHLLSGVTSHSSCVNGVQFSADGLYLISSGNDNTVQLWNTSTGRNMCVDYGRVVNTLKKTLTFAVSADCEEDLIFMPNEVNRSVDVFNMISGKKLNSLTGHYLSVNCCVYHPEKHELYTAGSDRNILIWTPNVRNAAFRDIKALRRVKRFVRDRSKDVKNIQVKTEVKVKSEIQVKTEGSNGFSIKQEVETNGVGEVVSSSVPNSVTADSWSSDEET